MGKAKKSLRPPAKPEQSPPAKKPERPLLYAPLLPPTPSIVVPLVVGTFMGTPGAIDLAVDLHGDAALLAGWHRHSEDLSFVRHFRRFALPLLLPLLLGKVLFVSLPAAKRGEAGAFAGCAPLVLLPLIIGLTIRARMLLESAGFEPSADALAHLTTLHAARLCLSVMMPASAAREYVLKLRSGLMALERKIKVE